MPTSVLVGERTLAAPRSVSRLLAGAFDARTVVVPGAAHMIPLTHPAAIVSYDSPASLFGSFGVPEAAEIGAKLEGKLQDLLTRCL